MHVTEIALVRALLDAVEQHFLEVQAGVFPLHAEGKRIRQIRRGGHQEAVVILRGGRHARHDLQSRTRAGHLQRNHTPLQFAAVRQHVRHRHAIHAQKHVAGAHARPRRGAALLHALNRCGKNLFT